MTGAFVRWRSWLLPWGIFASKNGCVPFRGRDGLVAHICNSRARLVHSVVSPALAKMKNPTRNRGDLLLPNLSYFVQRALFECFV